MPTSVTLVLDDAITRMCLKYRVNPSQFMTDVLYDEIHARALAEERAEVMRCQGCPHQVR